MRKINEVIIHCSATPEGKDFKAADIEKWHRERGFSRIGYHYIVDLDGRVEFGRPIDEQGAHCKNHNANSIGICYIGGLAKDGKTPKDTRTTEQRATLIWLVRTIKGLFPAVTVHSHSDFAAKACPCFDATREYKDVRPR